VAEGQIVGLIGPNGAGKTTLFNTVCGVYKPTSGKVFFNGEDITGISQDRVAAKGLVRSFQSSILFHNLTVLDNVSVGYHLHARQGVFGGVIKSRYYRDRELEISKKTKDTLAFMGLDGLHDELARNLPHGLQRKLGVAIAMAAQPKMLMLDEAATGLNPKETADMMDLLRHIRERGITILLVEHDMKVVKGICEHVIVMEFGKKIAEGPYQEISQNRDVIEAYLGAGYVT
jgi:branched-chain amino acid transport system ATP-binding protein